MAWDAVREMNEARAALGEEPFLYTGDGDIRQGGYAIQVDRRFGFANVVECIDMGSAVGDTGVAVIETTSVPLDRMNLAARRRARSALSAIGETVRGLAADYPGDAKWKRMALLAYALNVYGYRDSGRSDEFIHDAEGYREARGLPDDWDCGDNVVDGGDGLLAQFIERLA